MHFPYHYFFVSNSDSVTVYSVVVNSAVSGVSETDSSFLVRLSFFPHSFEKSHETCIGIGIKGEKMFDVIVHTQVHNYN